jgi:hypothetical protein
MYTEWGFQQMVTMFGNFGIDSGVGVLQYDVLCCALETMLEIRVSQDDELISLSDSCAHPE